MVRTPCCKAELGLKKGAWTPEEDQKLLSYVNLHGEGGWRTLPEKAGLKRCGKSCRLRWANYLRPDIKRGEFTENEEHSIISLHSIHGNRWSAIARGLPGRTDNEIKNYWNTHIKKRLIKNGVDPITHKNINSKNLSESSQNVILDQENENFKKKKYSSAKFLNKVANRFGKRFNQSVLTEIISSGGGPQRSVSVDSESEKSTNSSIKTTPSSSSTFSDSSSVNEGLNIDDVAFSRFMSDEDFMMLEESCYDENNVFMNELKMFLQGDVENDVVVQVMKTPTPQVYYDQDVFEEIDNYFG